MTDEELREATRNNYYAQLAGLGYGTDGMSLEDRITVVRCKDCKKMGTISCPIMFIPFTYIPRGMAKSMIRRTVTYGDWYCAEGERK